MPLSALPNPSRRMALILGASALGSLLVGCGKRPPPPLLASGYPAPRQAPLSRPESRHLPDGVVLTLRARYDITAHVMSVEEYSDSLAPTAPVDFALAWGAAATAQAQASILVSQGGRWYRYRGADETFTNAIALEMGREMANVHIIPASLQLRNRLLRVRRGDSVRLQGYLVDVRHPTEGYRTTSMSREDTGAGACEILLVEAFEALRTA